MRTFSACAMCLVLACLNWSQQPPATPASPPEKTGTPARLTDMFKEKITAEWDAFKNRDKQAYSNLLADDFAAVEDDNQGMRNKSAAVAEIDRSVVNDYHLFALTVIPLDPDSALVTYEITLQFPPKSTVHFKRVLVSEVWIKRNKQWKERYYQETHVR